MTRSSKSATSSSRYEPYAREVQPSQEEALHDASDVARIFAIDAEINRLYRARYLLVQRVGPDDLFHFLSRSEAEEFIGDRRKTRPTWTMVRELIRQQKTANQRVLDFEIEKDKAQEDLDVLRYAIHRDGRR
jgi:hypothetical protein